jgi:phospholipid-binding lipoprotein MlaA
MRLVAFFIAAGVLLSGCASLPAAPDGVNDPYEATNRMIFDFNLTIDRTFLHPTAEYYQTYVPEDVRDALHDALDNLHAPVVVANDLLQAEPSRAGAMTDRFLINSTLASAA